MHPLLMCFLSFLFVRYKHTSDLFSRDVKSFVKILYMLLLSLTGVGFTLSCQTMYILTSTVKISKYLCKPRFR
jgi:hypothetical protein